MSDTNFSGGDLSSELRKNNDFQESKPKRPFKWLVVLLMVVIVGIMVLAIYLINSPGSENKILDTIISKFDKNDSDINNSDNLDDPNQQDLDSNTDTNTTQKKPSGLGLGGGAASGGDTGSDSGGGGTGGDSETEVIEDENTEVIIPDENVWVPTYFPGTIYESNRLINQPNIYQDIVVWAENYNIYYMNVIDQEPIIITTTGQNDTPKIYGSNIIYLNYENGCVFLYNLDNNTTSQISEELVDCRNLFIYDNKITWTSYVGGTMTGGYLSGGKRYIHLYDLDSQQMIENIETSIETLSNPPRPIIYDSKILWNDFINNSWKLFVQDIDSNQTSEIQVNTTPFISAYMYNNKVIYLANNSIYLYNLTTQTESIITGDDARPIDYPVLNDNYVFWSDTRNGFRNHDLYFYNLSTSQEGVEDDDIHYYEKNPFLFGNKLIYLKHTNTGTENLKIILKILE